MKAITYLLPLDELPCVGRECQLLAGGVLRRSRGHRRALLGREMDNENPLKCTLCTVRTYSKKIYR